MIGVMQEAKKGQQGGDLAVQLFSDLDSDGDGSLSLKESGLAQDQYDALDTDKNGGVSQAELEKAIETQRAAMATRMMLDEGAAPPAADGASKPDAQDLLASILNGTLPPPPPMGEHDAAGRQNFVSAILEDLDSDDSGDLSLDESGLSQSTYDSLDTNMDGTVSAEELAAAFPQPVSASDSAEAGSTASGLITSKARDFLSMLANNAYLAASQASDAASLLSINATV